MTATFKRFEQLWNQFDDRLRDHLSSEGLADFLQPLVVSTAGDTSDPNKEIPKVAIPPERAGRDPAGGRATAVVRLRARHHR